MNVVKQATYASLILATIGIGMGFQRSGPISSSNPGEDRTWSKYWTYERQRARAHQRMENTMFASTPDRARGAAICPVLSDGRLGPPIMPDLRGALLKSDARRYSAKADETESEAESALAFFLNHISGPIVQAKCVNCHVEGGVSGHTRLILHPSSNADHGTLNLAVFKNFLATVEDGGSLILNKIQGVGHGGGVQVAAGTADFANMERLLELLGYGDGSGPALTPETLFNTVTMASPGKTLRRAALIFGGEVPTGEDMEAVENGTEEDLRVAIRNLMTGPGFHEFLTRASNDRLLTDRHLYNVIDQATSYFVDFLNLNWTKRLVAIEKGHNDPHADHEFDRWWAGVQHGFGRAPLELIAHVVENDLPYTEVLTADYIMANPMAGEAYGATTDFNDGEDPLEFQPSEIVSYYRDDDSKVTESDLTLGTRVLDPGNLLTDYPHAGILNTTVFLLRYPTTPTNRNRARSRWTYYHFLGLDIEKSASRTTDPVALADTDNPTMNNPACTVCHRVMDPVAGAFQNYGEEGFYRDEWEGLDSLDFFYKYPPDGSYSPYKYGDSWYRDMRDPGFNGEVAHNSENSLQWLAERIVADDRFAEGTVKFWWPAVLGVEVAEPPENENDRDFEAILLASNAQSAEVKRLAEAFRAGISGGRPYNLKDLLVAIVLSPWFRAASITDDDPVRAAALRNAGVERLLTPEELAWKTQAITGYSWGRSPMRSWKLQDGSAINNSLTDPEAYRLLYGGIDSRAVTERADDMTATMAAVAQSHALESSCAIVQREFLLVPDENRRLFGRIDQNVSPISEMSGNAVIESESWSEPETNSWSVSLSAGRKNVRLGFLNDFDDWETQDHRNLILDEVVVFDAAGGIVARVELETLDPAGCQGPYWNDSLDRHDGYGLYCHGWLDVSVSIPADGNYRIEVVAYQRAAGDEPAMLEIVVESDIETSRGARTIRRKLVELHEKLLGATVSADSPDVEAAFRLFAEVWEHKRNTEEWREEYVVCDTGDDFYFEGIADDVLQYNEDGDLEYDWERAGEVLDDADSWSRGRQDPVFQTWVVVLAYLLTDYRYLFL